MAPVLNLTKQGPQNRLRSSIISPANPVQTALAMVFVLCSGAGSVVDHHQLKTGGNEGGGVKRRWDKQPPQEWSLTNFSWSWLSTKWPQNLSLQLATPTEHVDMVRQLENKEHLRFACLLVRLLFLSLRRHLKSTPKRTAAIDTW